MFWCGNNNPWGSLRVDISLVLGRILRMCNRHIWKIYSSTATPEQGMSHPEGRTVQSSEVFSPSSSTEPLQDKPLPAAPAAHQHPTKISVWSVAA